MIQAMYSGIAGMKAFKSSLDVIGNNIANVNTTAYKAARSTFKEMLSQTLKGASGPSGGRGGINPAQVGLGVVVGSIDVDQTQGSLLATGRTTDLAIEGNGFFAVGDGTRTYYTRDGSFTLDANNTLVTSGTGMKVLGWTADPITGLIDTTQPIGADSRIEIPIGAMSVARQTSVINISGNLDASSAPGDQHTVTFHIYDSLGITHEVRVQFTKSATPAQWDYEVYCPDVGSAAVASGALTFNPDGFNTVSSIPISLTFAEPNGSTQPLIASIDTKQISQLAGEGSTADMSYQDGLPLGTLESFSIGRTGLISGAFTNGSTRALGQLVLANFTNPSGLLKAGNSLLTESPNSGNATLGIPGSGELGLVTSGFLEGSNVDLAAEFANMIVAQRGFQASSRIISTSNEILQELVTLAR